MKGLTVVACLLITLLLSTSAMGASNQSIEDVFWQSVQKSDVLEEYRIYIKQYPNGKYQKQAKRRIRQLEAKENPEKEELPVVSTERPKKRNTFRPLSVIQDCPDCPEMVVIPAGSFNMGSSEAEQKQAQQQGANKTWTDWEYPQHLVHVATFLLGKTEVSVGQWRAFTASTNYHTRCSSF